MRAFVQVTHVLNRVQLGILGIALAALLPACHGDKDSATGPAPDDSAPPVDVDGDGYVASSDGGDDCNDSDPSVHPDADDPWYDGVDSDCLGNDDYDQDGDGQDVQPTGPDCDDLDPARFIGNPEVCDEVDNDCDETVDEDATDTVPVYADDDLDGYGRDSAVTTACEAAEGQSLAGGDCNDGDSAMFPGAEEICNGADDDCDTYVDNDPVDGAVYYPDFDEDTFGDDNAATRACASPENYVDVAGDCDDSDPLTYADAEEICDERDNDCDSEVDEGATDPRIWYPDDDGDGYGTDGATLAQCSTPDGYADSRDDCDDGDGAVNPGAFEACNDIDDNCNGTIDSDSPDATEYHPDADGDGYGDAHSGASSCTAISDWTTDDADCLDTDATVNPSGSEACNGLDDDCDGTTDPDGASGSETYYEDADHDGYGGITTLDACSLPDGYAPTSDDCDDTTAEANPRQREVCDSIDNNCDLAIDEDDAADAPTWHADSDSDTYGSDVDTHVSCSATSGYIEDGSDCDDSDPTVSPAGTESENAVDDDCDILVDEDFISAGDIVIDEVARQVYTGGDGSSKNDKAQWFELHNTTAADIDVSGWYLEEGDGDSFYISPDAALVVPAGGYTVLCYEDTWFADPTVCDYQWSDTSLGSAYYDVTYYFDRDDDLAALYLAGDLVDSVHWHYDATAGFWPRTAHYSMRLDDDTLNATSNDDLDSWCLSSATVYSSPAYAGHPDYGTPGSSNGSCD